MLLPLLVLHPERKTAHDEKFKLLYHCSSKESIIAVLVRSLDVLDASSLRAIFEFVCGTNRKRSHFEPHSIIYSVLLLLL